MSLSEEEANKLWQEKYELEKGKRGLLFATDLYQSHMISERLREAKKEWLLIDDFRYNELGKGYISQAQAWQDWFKKWFGSE